MTARALTSAAEARVALERLAATARQDLLLCLPALSAATPLVMPELRERGLETWGDLLALLPRRGVSLRILVPDCDPLQDPARHRAAWAAVSGLADVLPGEVQLLCAAHGQRASGLKGWLLGRHLRPALGSLRADEQPGLTPVQRGLLRHRPAPQPVEINQTFAVADGQRAILGGHDLGSDGMQVLALWVDDGDFAGALRGHFADTWSDAMNAGAPSLGASATEIPTPTRPQSRDDLRLLRTRSCPRPGFAPRAVAEDFAPALKRLIGTARQRIVIRTTALLHPDLADALVQASGRQDLQFFLLLPQQPVGTWDNAQAAGLQAKVLARLHSAYGQRLVARTLTNPTPATLCLIDDTCVIGSTALTHRACHWNTETAALVRDGALTQAFLEALAPGMARDGADAADRCGLGAPFEPQDNAARRGWLPASLF